MPIESANRIAKRWRGALAQVGAVVDGDLIRAGRQYGKQVLV